MTPEIGKTYLLRNGTRGLVDELLSDGTFYGIVTAPATDLRVRVIWDKDGASTKRGSHWDLTMLAPDIVDDEPEFIQGHPVVDPRNFICAESLTRIAAALERIADHLENQREI